MLNSVMGSYQGSKAGWVKATLVFVVVFVILAITRQLISSSTASESGSLVLSRKIVNAATWNVAAINNNPFEYWITSNDSNYLALMTAVSEFIDHPSKLQDAKVSEIFNESMAQDLFSLLSSAKWHGVNTTEHFWRSEYSNRSIISEFLKDDMLGRKRLVSMPDRVTNTINTANGKVAYRPTVINCYGGRLSSMGEWWTAWRSFMFHSPIMVKKGSSVNNANIYQLLSPISKAKYPSITKEEAEVSLPLQTLCLAVFDAILLHMMNSLGANTWQPIRSNICRDLNHRKNFRTLEILEQSYSDMDVIFLQEVAANFHDVAQRHRIANLYDIHQPEALDQDRDQNSFILLQKGRYHKVREVTAEVMKFLNTSTKVPVARGDLLVLLATDQLDNSQNIFASFHGDTNGLATKPVVAAVHGYALVQQPKAKLLFGLDANTYAEPESDQQGVTDFANFYVSKRLNSCYGRNPNPYNFTTFNARTHLQPQLNKAVAYAEKDKKGDKNPKDFILFFDSDYSVQHVTKDNTGERQYIENMVFPTLRFPSDHGITSATLLETISK